ncbi:Clp protease N-terminal domain-containing protein [Actinoplanes sp. NPDC051494]|uniref:Clp protease N-terminal domain-containing protein n=1 Tax=Actinoplanes sp. NPDC051494 TaxID=3363907 RepID=UPI00379A07A5
MTVQPSAPFASFDIGSHRVLTLARTAAVRLRSPAVDRDHLMIALLRVRHGLGGPVAVALGAKSPFPVRGRAPSPSHLPFTPAAERALSGAAREAQRLGDPLVGTGHLLLGVLQVGDLAGLTHAAVDAELARRR